MAGAREISVVNICQAFYGRKLFGKASNRDIGVFFAGIPEKLKGRIRGERADKGIH